MISTTTRRLACASSARTKGSRSPTLYRTCPHTTTSDAGASGLTSGHRPSTVPASTPASRADARNPASMSADSSTPVIRVATVARGRDVAPPPTPTSSTSPPVPSAPSAIRVVALGSAGRRSARVRNSSVGKPQGDSGAAATISSGIAQPASSARQRSSALTPRAPSAPRPCARRAEAAASGPAGRGRRRGSGRRPAGATRARGRRSPGSSAAPSGDAKTSSSVRTGAQGTEASSNAASHSAAGRRASTSDRIGISSSR